MRPAIRRPWRHLAQALAFALVAWGVTSTAQAQPLETGVSVTPTALILFDSSGSMEWLDNEDEYPFCLSTPTQYASLATSCTTDAQCQTGLTCDTTAGVCVFARSRYHQAVEVLTGSIPDYYPICDFRDQDADRVDQLATSPDQGIRHSIACSSANSLTFDEECYRTPDGSIIAPPGFRQRNDGIIDLYGSLVHFGFMAFDSFQDPASDATGMWSYGRAGWSPTPGAGRGICPSGQCWDLGGRSPATGVEGRTIAPLDPADDTDTRRDQINLEVQASILEVVPYWSTPIGSIIEDALTFYTGGESSAGYSWFANADPSGTDPDAWDYSRALEDPYLTCRRRYAILITDGLPTYDECVRTGTTTTTDPWDLGCEGYWYGDAEYYAGLLADEGIDLYVIGFNINQTNPDGTPAADRLTSIAVAGGTDEVYYADGSRELLFQLGNILSQISRGTPSRTAPATTTRLASDRLGEFRFQSGFEIHEDSRYWSGNLDRLAWECVGGSLPNTPTIESAATRLDARPLTGSNQRTIYVAQPSVHSCELSSGSTRPSLFPDTRFASTDLLAEMTEAEVAEACSVGFGAGGTTAQASCLDLTDGDVGMYDVELPESNSTLANACLAQIDAEEVLSVATNFYQTFGAASSEEAQIYLRWLRGETLGDLDLSFRSELADLLPANVLYDSVTGTYPDDRVSALADIFHSNPTVVTTPSPLASTADDYQRFVTDTRDRPSMIYVGTNDGLLHAFNAETLEEEWAFLPASFLPRIGEWLFTGHSFMFDGSPVVRDLVINRQTVDGEVQGDWRTVLVAGYRSGGRGYVAMDVTDPERPSMLWELDAELDPRLGETYGEAALATVLFDDCPGISTERCERGVVILPGGRPPVGSDANTAIGRVIYVVDAETGEVYARLTEANDMDGNTIAIPSPVVGSVAAFDASPTSLATRAFVGDSAGRLLRVDMRSGDPDEWYVDVFFDPAHSTLGVGDSRPAASRSYGEVRFRPSIALDPDGRVVVIYGMGNVDNLDDLGNERHYVLSLTETAVRNTLDEIIRVVGDVNWGVQLESYEKMTGPPVVFNNAAYFPTFVPNNSDLCDFGGARLYGLHYRGTDDNRGNVGTITTTTFDLVLAQDPEDPEVTAANPLVPYYDSSTTSSSGVAFIPPRSIIHSLEIVRRAACYLEETVSDGSRGEYASDSRITGYDEYEPEYQLQIGVSSQSGSLGDNSAEAVSGVVEYDLPTPSSRVSVTSWTTILE